MTSPNRLVVSPVPGTLDTAEADCRRWMADTVVCSDRWDELSPGAIAWFTTAAPR